jgi:hypothetical protein
MADQSLSYNILNDFDSTTSTFLYIPQNPPDLNFNAYYPLPTPLNSPTTPLAVSCPTCNFTFQTTGQLSLHVATGCILSSCKKPAYYCPVLLWFNCIAWLRKQIYHCSGFEIPLQDRPRDDYEESKRRDLETYKVCLFRGLSDMLS